MSSEFTTLSTDELLELLPSNLYLARADYGAMADRWRFFNTHTKVCHPPGYRTAREALIGLLTRHADSRKLWIAGDGHADKRVA